MIKILNLSSRSYQKFWSTNSSHYFSTASDPYYILGVDKAADFKQIKKCFFKLANEYHPDKNQTADAKKKFIIVKQAFEQIKMQKGLMKPQNFVNVQTHSSSRPNPSQFNSEQQQSFQTNRDYRIFREKSQSSEQFSQFNSSFKTIHDINDIKIKVQQGKMKDAAQRFNLEGMRIKITSRSQAGLFVIILGIASILGLLSLINIIYDQSYTNTRKQQIVTNSQFIKENTIETDNMVRQKSKQQRQKKVKYDEFLKIINKTQNNDKKQTSRELLTDRSTLAQLIPKTKQTFIVSNDKSL